MTTNLTRRKFCQSAGLTFMLLPVVCIQASAKTNAAMRENLNYQNTPNGTKSCATCLEFTPGQSDQKTGSCKLIPGDDEISASGYCLAWNTM